MIVIERWLLGRKAKIGGLVLKGWWEGKKGSFLEGRGDEEERERWRKGRGFEEERGKGLVGEEGGEGLDGQGWRRGNSSHGHGVEGRSQEEEREQILKREREGRLIEPKKRATYEPNRFNNLKLINGKIL